MVTKETFMSSMKVCVSTSITDMTIETVFQDQAVVEARSAAQNLFLGRELMTGLGRLK